MSTKLQRRAFLKTSGALGLGTLVAGTAIAETCSQTPAQTAGPFYPARRRTDENFDLTQVEGRSGFAAGEAVVIAGVVKDLACEPVAGAIVEIWQAGDNGRYDHPQDTNPAPLDPNFQYWGRVTTGADGAYAFKTVYPGLYPGRTRHIHFRVIAQGRPTLTTQLYFEGEARNASDGVYRGMTAAQRRLVTTTMTDDPITGLRAGSFDITLRGGRSRSGDTTGRETPELD